MQLELFPIALKSTDVMAGAPRRDLGHVLRALERRSRGYRIAVRSGRLAQSETAPAIRDPLSSQMHSSAQANHRHGFPEGEGVGVGVGRPAK